MVLPRLCAGLKGIALLTWYGRKDTFAYNKGVQPHLFGCHQYKVFLLSPGPLYLHSGLVLFHGGQ